MMILQNAGRIALAQAVAAQTMYIAWGTGDGQWSEPPQTTDDNTSMQAEIGRRLVTQVGYAVPATADDYDIELPGGNYFKTSPQPTAWLHIQCAFDFADGDGQTIREVGLFVGGTAAQGVPPGKRYLLPHEVGQQGQIYLLENRHPVLRTSTLKAVEEIILPF